MSTSSSAENHSLGLAATRSPWHSPVPYLFGGLAAMLGLIAFALLILACSYWRLSSEDDENQQSDQDLEKGDGINKIQNKSVYEDKIVVIMAGDHNPTFLANPVQIFLNNHVSKHESTTTTTTTNHVIAAADDDDDKAKEDEDEHVQHHN